MIRQTCWVAALLLSAVSLFGQQTLYFRVDYIYANAKELATVRPAPSDQTAPTAPSSLSSSNVTASSVQLSWTASTDNVAVVGYRMYRGNLPVGAAAPGTTTFTDPHLQPSTSYSFTVRSLDAAQNFSSASNTVSVTTSSASTDTTAPSVPSGLSGRALGATSIQLNWSASTDTGGSGVASYRLYRGGSLIASPTATTYTDPNLSSYTSYSYTIAAVDGQGNTSAQSASISVTTQPTLVFSDNFNRADTTNLQNTNWASTTWGISYNTAVLARPTSGQGSWTNALTVATAGTFRATAKVLSWTCCHGLVFWNSSGAGLYRVYLSSNGIILSYFDSQGNETVINNPYTCGVPCTLSVTAYSSNRNIQVTGNGTLLINFTDTNTSRPNSGQAGLTAILAYDALADAIIDDFKLEQ